MPTSEKKREACRRNAQNSTGPKRTYLTRFNAVKRGSYAKVFVPRGAHAKPFREVEKELRADLLPQPGLLEFLFRRLLSIVWAILQIERAELLHLEKSASINQSKAHADTQQTDEEIVALDPLIPEARARILARSKEKGPKLTPGSDVSPIGPDDIDRAVLDGFAHPGQGGELSQLRHEKRQLERDLDRAIKAYRSAQQDQVIDLVPRVVRADLASD